MKVYRFYANTNRYQYFMPQPLSDRGMLITNCRSRAASWQPPSLDLQEPTHPRGDFFEFYKGSPILSARAVDRLRQFLMPAGELLPLPYAGETFYLFNVVPCIDCLDAEATEWRLQFNKRLWPDKYVFTAPKFGPNYLFKIPQTCRAEVLVLDREDGRGFVEALTEHELLGYTLDLLWSGS
jgi:hypothetical protein